MAKLIIATSAQQHLSDIHDYIARDTPIAAANWVEKIEEKSKLIAATPKFEE
ncbi:type II toxin-antitoxin system RelE/ParE family toxin [Rhodopirellula sp. JC740]|uniref:Type II toxin-antitoxin system RelE/ParE family toxin n=1 Tax=Rhodopirellula halodulae TaxID=2894198 RepID=A0ABS8NDC5_9BACT|nr:type II toxin-antitoxin system RelE/ParE family toxin [Rhodopirellula sp. JC740]MCC9641556.1 type II toxin-antitoxin system RelE/ParE family toxin [Rhodopirellula sp. JC740]